MANAANHVTLSSGQILFADPTRPWDPSNLPNFPSTSLAFTAAGTIATRDLSTLTFSNAITYQTYENTPQIRSQLTKSLVVDAAGNVTYDDPKVSLVSTSLTAYSVGISNWAPPSIGAAGIQGSPPDTLTNAIAKLDGWIANSLLVQPPAVTVAQVENTSLYAGIRWLNYPVYNVFQYSVPYTTSINLILGNPSTGNYLSLQLTNPDWFPDRQFTDGLAADFDPIVRLRIFNSFFPTGGPNVYSKAYMQTQCVRILDEGGTYTLPATGKVFSVDTYPSGENYTTINLYLPQIPTGVAIPVNIVYLNKTQGGPNFTTTSTFVNMYGGPSGVSTISQYLSSPTSFTLAVTPPIYSDEANGVSTCYFSSYTVGYRAIRMNTAHSANLGFRYGFASPNVLPLYLSSYNGSTFKTSTAAEGGAQNITVAGSGASQVLPGLQWSTTIFATNSAHYIGSTVAGPNPVVSAFPTTSTVNISSVAIEITSPWAVAQTENKLAYLHYNNGWNISGLLSTNVVFLSTAQQAAYQITAPVQFNDTSYPGCRSNVQVESLFKDIDGVTQILGTTIAPVAEDFTLGVPYGSMNDSNSLSTILTDTGASEAFHKFFYSAAVSGTQMLSTISLTPQTLEARLHNFAITDYNDPIVAQTLSTPLYVFQTEQMSSYETSSIMFASSVTNLQPISGLFTPSIDSQIYFDIHAKNFLTNFTNFSSIAMAQFEFDGMAAGPVEKYTSSLRVFDAGVELTSLPFPINSMLTVSSVSVSLTSNIYQDPTDPASYALRASATPANPVAPHAFSVFDIGPFMYTDTVSQPSTFTNIDALNGQRVLSLLPRYESPGTVNNMNDGVALNGQTSNGLDVTVSSLFIMGLNNNLTVSSSAVYNNLSTISSIYTDPYTRELILANGRFSHPGGLDFSQFSGIPLGNPEAVYPSFVNDLAADVNYGNRYASFIFNAFKDEMPTFNQFINICVKNPSAISTITNSRTYNYAFPDKPIPNPNLQYSKVRMHMKVLGAYNDVVYTPLETAWINCFKPIDYGGFADDIYDIGGCVSVSTSGADVWYKVQMDRRYFTSIYPLIRVGISRDGSAEGLPAGSAYLPISFDGISVHVSDT